MNGEQISLLDQFLTRVTTFNPYPILYSRTATGAVQTWRVEVVGNQYRFITGQKGGALITSEWTTCQGKNLGRANQTTGEEQAAKEAKAALKKKLKSGGYWENEADIDKLRFFEPMLAYKLKDYRESLVYPVMVDRKYNGGRIIANREGLKTRKGENYITIPHIFNVIKHLFIQFPDLVLDGEGYNHDLRFKLNECMSLLRKTKKATSEDISRAEQIIQYHVYDGYGFTVNGKQITKDTPCFERRDALFHLLKGISYIFPVEYVVIFDEKTLMSLYEGFISDGYEGAIVRRLNAPYQNKRTKDLLKVKPMDDDEFEIVNVEEGTGNWAGKAKRITFRMRNGETFGGSFKGTMEQAERCLKEKNKWIGQTVTVNYFGFTGLGTPNYAQLDINNCIKNDR
jgi:DNA ligase 1